MSFYYSTSVSRLIKLGKAMRTTKANDQHATTKDSTEEKNGARIRCHCPS
jgi:hypothetical protein